MYRFGWNINKKSEEFSSDFYILLRLFYLVKEIRAGVRVSSFGIGNCKSYVFAILGDREGSLGDSFLRAITKVIVGVSPYAFARADTRSERDPSRGRAFDIHSSVLNVKVVDLGPL